MLISSTSTIIVKLESLTSKNIMEYNTTLGSFLNANNNNPLIEYLNSTGKLEELLTFPKEESIINILNKQKEYITINEVLGLVVAIKIKEE